MSQCWVGDGKLFRKTEKSKFSHGGCRVAVSTNHLFALGSNYEDGYSKAEWLNIHQEIWSTLPEYPYERRLFAHTQTFHDGYFYIFGGFLGLSDTNTVSRFHEESKLWSKIGKIDSIYTVLKIICLGALNHERRAHAVIFVEDYFLVVGGGLGQLPTEKCRLQGASLSCIQDVPYLTNYAYHPELFIVPDNFCI